MYNIVYLWQGKQLLGPQYSILREALAALDKFRADGWDAWIECHGDGWDALDNERRSAPLYAGDPTGWALTIERIVAENFPYDVDSGCRIYAWEDAGFGADEDEEYDYGAPCPHTDADGNPISCSEAEGYDPALDPGRRRSLRRRLPGRAWREVTQMTEFHPGTEEAIGRLYELAKQSVDKTWNHPKQLVGGVLYRCILGEELLRICARQLDDTEDATVRKLVTGLWTRLMSDQDMVM